MTEERITQLLALVDDVIQGRPLTHIPVPFAMQGEARTECILAISSFELATFRPASDGSYHQSRGLFFATSPIGLALTAAVAAFQVAANSRRKKAARAALQPRWVAGGCGTLAISQFGFYLATEVGLHYWGWAALNYCFVVDDARIELLGRTDGGQVRWQLTSELAELIFFLWAIVRAPSHPQLCGPRWSISIPNAHVIGPGTGIG